MNSNEIFQYCYKHAQDESYPPVLRTDDNVIFTYQKTSNKKNQSLTLTCSIENLNKSTFFNFLFESGELYVIVHNIEMHYKFSVTCSKDLEPHLFQLETLTEIYDLDISVYDNIEKLYYENSMSHW